MQQVFHWKRIWVGLVISIGVRQNRLPLQLFHSNRRFLRIFGYRFPKANFLANQTISGSTSWHSASTLSWTELRKKFRWTRFLDRFGIDGQRTLSPRCSTFSRMERSEIKRKLNEDCRRPLSDENVSLMISLVLGVDKKKSLRRVCETSGIGTVLELGTRSRRYRSRQVGDTFTQQRRSFAYTAAVREPVVYSSSLRGACTNTAFCNGL